jgi:signal transduction histidine kinase
MGLLSQGSLVELLEEERKMDLILTLAEESRVENGQAGDSKRAQAPRRHDEFLAQLGHELRGPLAAIMNALEVLRHCGGDPVQRAWVERVLDHQTNQMIRLVEDLMDLCRTDQRAPVLATQPVDLAAIVQSAIETVRPFILERGHRLEVTMPGAPLTLKADPVRLEQVLTNLLTNAAKYTDPCGRIELAAAREIDEIVVTVRDTGVGIAPEELAHIFGPFWQSSRAVDHARGGLGIGLALVRHLVEMHGGSVCASSAGLGLGAEFVVRLPLAAKV